MQTGGKRQEAQYFGCKCCGWAIIVPRKGKEMPRVWARKEKIAKPKNKDIRRFMKIYSSELCSKIELRRGRPPAGNGPPEPRED